MMMIGNAELVANGILAASIDAVSCRSGDRLTTDASQMCAYVGGWKMLAVHENIILEVLQRRVNVRHDRCCCCELFPTMGFGDKQGYYSCDSLAFC